ncbi:hypothetical protein Kpol_363p12 [Vanderwaltozyma polyspora DSM 70294]|uniref:AAA+ ATPase domain-containing protein n=1 Tax=Vanderwaltozyma polyspora (strain ATCC 22028 / DSM 70294 / BCRC 21397 / CBS 2163 / NBRC 10782 / NRRL Y-8283 / UCD 57-17) TaxID=436907 RepID=A7TS95_VANPO|nr:uncharacterized protein Kpol_363p12 [Vanderwaltozyma polyspora DSM 70294]EDO14872.1 hypothetical protein Kpol_363p12 [Vanderwaltozyma polyspora DSM 70294]
MNFMLNSTTKRTLFGICKISRNSRYKYSSILIRFNHTSGTSDAERTPIEEYDRLVKLNKLRDDQYQRGVIKTLGTLYDALKTYKPPEVKTPSALDQVGWKANIFQKFKSIYPTKKESITDIGQDIPKGIYLYGDVGCGKTMLMDLFYSTVPSHLSKKRIHFHQFMQDVHKRSHEIIKEQNLDDLGREKGVEIDPIPFLAAEISNTARLLCFDEFQVTDVADAMILRRLLTLLLSSNHGVVLFATSNRHPDELYINGVQRQTFIPCIELIKSRTAVTHLNSPTDYRKIPRPVSSVYYYPEKGLQYDSRECALFRQNHVKEWYDYFSQIHIDKNLDNHKVVDEIVYNYKLTTWGREINVPKCTVSRVAQFTFKELCGQPLAAGDYLTLANNFKAFIITDIPFLSVYVRDEVRRFITFLDAVYDNGGKIATTAADKFSNLFVDPSELLNDFELKPIEKETDTKEEELLENDELVTKHGFTKEIAKGAQLFALDEEKFAFARALSRLSQMSSTEWVSK